MGKTRILIAEDNRDFARLLEAHLSTVPEFEVAAIALDGNLTVEMAEKTRPDVLLLDLMLPGMNGIEAIQKLQDKGVQAKTIVISAIGSDEEIIRKAIALGAQRFFVKPFEISSLVSAIKDII